MKSFSSIQILILVFQIIHVIPTDDSNPNPRSGEIKLTEPCILLLVRKFVTSHQETSVIPAIPLACELQGADAALVGPNILNIDDAIIEWLESANVVSGETTLFFPDLLITEKSLELPDGVLTTDNIILGTVEHEETPLRVLGEKTVLVVRVQASNEVTSFSEAYLSDSVFGNGNDTVNLSSQYSACSANKLNFTKATERTGNSTNISNGVTTITVTTSNSQGDEVMRNAITAELASQFAVSSPELLADHVMYCLPSGAMSSLAYAYMNSWLSIFNDSSCTYYSVQMQVIGHNIGLTPSYKGILRNKEFSGLMGASYSENDTPKMCFNGAKSWQLGWYSDRQKSINLSNEVATFNVFLVGVTHYASSKNNQYVVVQLTGGSKDYYLAFNRKFGMNNGTREGNNQVLITHTNSSESTLVAKLKKGEQYVIPNYGSSGHNVIISVNTIRYGEVPTVAFVVITNIDPPTQSPTKPPTQSPLKPPTQSPVHPPTQSPTKPLTQSPTKPPTQSPVQPPTQSPTKPPTQSPTKPPTKSPVQPPTQSPTKPHTQSPTKPPTQLPTMPPTEPSPPPSILPTITPTQSPVKPSTEPSTSPTTTPVIDKPNLVIIMTDEHNIRTLGCYRSLLADGSIWGKGVRVYTPNIDSLARDGAIFTNFNSVKPQCTPSRASFMSGLYPHFTGAIKNHSALRKRVVTFAEILQKKANYKTGFVGKWHLNGDEKPGFANKERPFGFDENKYQFNRGHWKLFEEDAQTGDIKAYNLEDWHKFKGNITEGYATDFLFRKGIDFMRRQIEKETQFALMLSIPDPHGPNDVRAPYDTMYDDMNFKLPASAVAAYHKKPALPAWSQIKTDLKTADKTITSIENDNEWQRNMRNYFGMVKLIDNKVGELLSFLNETGQDKNTIVVFTSDHGDMMAEHGNYNKNKPYQTSAGVPFIIRFPGYIKKSKVINTAYSSPDFAPTILSLMGIDHSDTTFQGIDGSDEILNDKQISTTQQVRFMYMGDWIAAVDHRYKLVVSKFDIPWLFDLKEDPNEMINYSTKPKHSWIMDRLQQKILNEMELYRMHIRNKNNIIFFDKPACYDTKDQIPHLPYLGCNNLRKKKHKDKCDLKEVKKYCSTTCGTCCKDSTGFISHDSELITCDGIRIQQWRCEYERISMFCPLACSKCKEQISLPMGHSSSPSK